VRSLAYVVAGLLLLSLCYTIPRALYAEEVDPNDHTNLANFITDFSFNSDGIDPVTGNPKATAGQTYLMSFTFAEDGVKTFDLSNGALTYTIPTEMNVADYLSAQPLYDASHNQVATFKVVGGVITITPDPSYTTAGSPANNFWSNVNTSFSITLGGTFSYTGDGQLTTLSIDFGDNYVEDIEVSPGPGDIAVTKSLGSYNAVTRTMDATVTYTADPTGSSVVIDSLSDIYALAPTANAATSGNLDVLGSNVTLVYTSADGRTTYTVPTGAVSYSVDNTPGMFTSDAYGAGAYGTSADQFMITPTTPLTLNPGDKLTMTYTLHVKDSYVGSQVNADDKTDNTVDYNGYLSNLGVVDAHDLNHNPLHRSKQANGTINGTVLWKSNGTGDGTTVSWAATVGDGSTNMGGLPITDTLSPSDQSFTGTFIANLYYSDNGVLKLMGSEVFTAKTSGTSTPTFYPTSGVTVTGSDTGSGAGSVSWNGATMTYTPPTSLSVNGNPVSMVVLNYTTTQPAVSSSNPAGSINNTLSTNIDSATAQAQADFTPSLPSSWDISKKDELKVDANGPYVEYTVIAKVPQIYYGQNLTLTDSLTCQTGSVMYYDDPSESVVGWVAGSPRISMARLLSSSGDNLSVNVYSLAGQYNNVDPATVDLSTLTQVDPSTFNTTSPTYSGSPSSTQLSPSTMTSHGSWNVLASGWNSSLNKYGSSAWTMTFGSGSSVSANASSSAWPVNEDSLLVVTYRAYLSSPIFDENQNYWWGDPWDRYVTDQSSAHYTTSNTAVLSSGNANVATQLNQDGTSDKYPGPSWYYSDMPPAIRYLPPATYSQPYYYYDGRYYFTFDARFQPPYLTELTAPPVFTDTFDPALTFDQSDPNCYFYVALHLAPISTSGQTLYYRFDLLVKVPANDVVVTGGNTITLDFAKLTSDPAVTAELYATWGGMSTIDYGIPLTIPAGYPDTPQGRWDYCKTLVAGTNGSYASDWGIDTSSASKLPNEWYSLNAGTDADFTNVLSGSTTDNTKMGVNPYGNALYDFDYALTFKDGVVPADAQSAVKRMSNNAQLTDQLAGGPFTMNGATTISFMDQPIGKSMPTTTLTTNNGNVINVNLNLNPYGLSVLGGGGTTYETVDAMTNLMYLPGTLKVYKISPCQGVADTSVDDNDAVVVKAPTTAPAANWSQQTMTELTASQMSDLQALMRAAQPVPDSYQYSFYVDTAGDYGPAGNVYFYLPDGVQFEIDYQALINGDAGSFVSFSNAVKITGTSYNYTASDTNIQIIDASGQGTSSRQPVTLSKEDDNTKTPLDGGVFALYSPVARLAPGGALRDVPPLDVKVGATSYTVINNGALPVGLDTSTGLVNIPLQITGPDGATYYYCETEVTGTQSGSAGAIASGSTGQVVFNHPILVPSLNWIYLMQEIVAPVGYSAQTDSTLFALDDSTVTAPSGVTLVTLDSSDDLTIFDDSESTDVDFNFTKTDETGEPLSGVQFCLTPCTSVGTVLSDAETTIRTSQADGSVSFTGLSKGTYLLEETKTRSGYLLPAGQWILTVDAKAEKPLVITALGSPMAFADHDDGYTLVNYKTTKLPFAGGLTLVVFIVGGIVLVGAGIIVLNTLRSKKRVV